MFGDTILKSGFVDDYSQITWFYLMKNPFRVILHIFLHSVLKLKLISMPLYTLCIVITQKNIFLIPFKYLWVLAGFFIKPLMLRHHLKIVLWTERHIHLFATARALLFQSHVPKCFWVHTISTTYFLVNRMSSSILNVTLLIVLFSYQVILS